MGVKNFCNAFLVHRLTERDEIRHDEGYLCVQVFSYFGELWSTFAGAQIFDSEYLAHFCHCATKIGRVRGYSYSPNFVWYRAWYPSNTMRRHASVIHRCTYNNLFIRTKCRILRTVIRGKNTHTHKLHTQRNRQ